MSPLLTLQDVGVAYPDPVGGSVPILSGVDLTIGEGEVLGLVGESGSGKSTLGLALMGLLPADATISARRAELAGTDLGGLAPSRVAALRGRDVAMVFQDPMAALNPLFTIGAQMVDAQRRKHPRLAKSELKARAIAMLDRVGVPDAEARMKRYPSEFSGGMRQRVLIAMALLVEPKLLIADEPTTALDATVEVQIAHLLGDLRRRIAGSILLISHSFGLVAETCDRVAVMYAGSIVEIGPVEEVLRRPLHPYTAALIACEIDPLAPADPSEPLPSIQGTIPSPRERPSTCLFAPRCPARAADCDLPPPLIDAGPGRQARCWRLAA